MDRRSIQQIEDDFEKGHLKKVDPKQFKKGTTMEIKSKGFDPNIAMKYVKREQEEYNLPKQQEVR